MTLLVVCLIVAAILALLGICACLAAGDIDKAVEAEERERIARESRLN